MHVQSKVIVILTSSILLLVFAFLLFFHHTGYEKAIPLYTTGQPTLGLPTAPVHVVCFEDPKCNNCIAYHNEAYEKIYDNYIRPGLIRYTVYLVGELPNSNVIGRMLLCVNSQSTPAFFRLLSQYYAQPSLALTTEEINTQLIRLAEDSQLAIHLGTLKQCVAQNTFENQILENTNYARAIMGGVIKTPTVFVDGIRLVRPSYEQLKKLIDLELKKRRSS